MSRQASVTPPTERARLYLVLACAGGVAVLTGVQLVAPAFSAIQARLGLDDSQVGLFTSIYLLPGVFLALPLGFLVDVLGRRRMFIIAMLLFGVAGPLQGLTTDYTVMLGLRAVQGVGFAVVMPLTITVIGDAFTGLQQVRAQATRIVVLTLGELVMPIVGGFLGTLSWRAPLFAQGIVLPLALAGMAILSDARLSTTTRQYGRNVRHAVLQPGMVGLLWAGAQRFLLKFALITYLPILLVNSFQASLALAGTIVALASAAASVSGIVAGRLGGRLRPSLLLIASVYVGGLALATFGYLPSWPWVATAAVVYGLSDGVLVVFQNGFLTQSVDANVRAGVVAAAGTIRNAGKFLAPILMGALLLALPLRHAFLVMGAAALVATPLLWPIRHLDRSFDAEPPADDSAIPPGVSEP